jgi:TetR/AcrR family transcriptional regulator, regulator of cefoperazone and chloramphenicol sensitivity
MPTTATTALGEDTRERLLVAACRHFAAHGFRGVSVRDICAEARANVAAVSYHFSGKEGLYLEALRRSFDVLRTPPLAFADGQGALPALREWIRVSVARSLSPSRPRWAAQLMWRELLDPTDVMRTLVREVMAPDLENVRKLLRACAPSLTDEAAVLWSFTIMGQIVLHDFARTPILELMGIADYGEEDAARIAAHLMNVVERALGIGAGKEDAAGASTMPATRPQGGLE